MSLARVLAFLLLPLSQPYPGAATVLVDEFDTSSVSIKSYAGRLLKSQRIDDFEERELIEIGVAGADLPDAVLAHENCSASIVEQIAGEVRQLVNEFARDVGMTMSRNENGEARRSEECRHELARRFCVPRPPHDPRMRCNAQKLVKYTPGRIPGIWSRPLALKPVAAGGIKL